MAITDELREWFKDRFFMANGWQEIHAIADRIDADAEDNERFRREAEPFCDRLREAAAERADVTLFGVDYVALPVDADGVPIHMGDVVRYDNLGNKGEPFEVKEITYRHGCEDEVGDGEQYGTIAAITVRHHHAPTVEDVLREFADRVCNSGHQWGLDAADTIAEYAARLRLAGDDE